MLTWWSLFSRCHCAPKLLNKTWLINRSAERAKALQNYFIVLTNAGFGRVPLLPLLRAGCYWALCQVKTLPLTAAQRGEENMATTERDALSSLLTVCLEGVSAPRHNYSFTKASRHTKPTCSVDYFCLFERSSIRTCLPHERLPNWATANKILTWSSKKRSPLHYSVIWKRRRWSRNMKPSTQPQVPLDSFMTWWERSKTLKDVGLKPTPGQFIWCESKPIHHRTSWT